MSENAPSLTVEGLIEAMRVRSNALELLERETERLTDEGPRDYLDVLVRVMHILLETSSAKMCLDDLTLWVVGIIPTSPNKGLIRLYTLVTAFSSLQTHTLIPGKTEETAFHVLEVMARRHNLEPSVSIDKMVLPIEYRERLEAYGWQALGG